MIGLLFEDLVFLATFLNPCLQVGLRNETVFVWKLTLCFWENKFENNAVQMTINFVVNK